MPTRCDRCHRNNTDFPHRRCHRCCRRRCSRHRLGIRSMCRSVCLAVLLSAWIEAHSHSSPASVAGATIESPTNNNASRGEKTGGGGSITSGPLEENERSDSLLRGAGTETTARRLVVGGRDAPSDRYPYFVSLQEVYNGTHRCAGTLVAPDVVVTAAHCKDEIGFAQVGKYSAGPVRSSPGGGGGGDTTEMQRVLGPLHVHPLFNAGVSFSHDVLLFRLERTSVKQYVAINTDPGVPRATGNSGSGGHGFGGQGDRNGSNNHGEEGNNLTILGIGTTTYTKFGASTNPKVLQETNTSFVPNRVCRRSKDPDVEDNYQNLISDDMLCAFETNQDACQGDSGGPLIKKGNSPSTDVLVGIVSWGFGCAHPSFPGVYSRISYVSEWVIATICQLSSAPPIEYDCANVMAPSHENSIPVTVIIQYDDHPGEISWSISQAESGLVLVNVTENLDTPARYRSQETVFLPPGSDLVFTIQDRYGDGLCCNAPGNYRVVLGRNAVGKVIAYGGGDFGREKFHSLRLPTDYVDDAEKPLIEDDQIALTVVIQLDGFPEETGWRIDRLGVQVEDVIRIPTGIYTTQEMTVFRTIILQKNELYFFNLYDIAGDGIDHGYVKLFLGTTDTSDLNRIIFESDGNFLSGVDHTFFAAIPPTILLPPSDSYMYLTLVMTMDLFPGEISLQLRMEDTEFSTNIDDERKDSIAFFRPPGYYKDRVNEVVTERIAIPQTPEGTTRHFSFIIGDRSADGLCCAWNGGQETGYTLYEGDPSMDNVIVHSIFKSAGREIKHFSISNDKVDVISLNNKEGEQQSVKIKVSIKLDLHPGETGFLISDSSGSRLKYVPPGTFKEQNAIVERSFAFHPGLYTFTIIDTFGDGMNRDEIIYSIDLLEDRNRPSILTGTGDFNGAKSHDFLIEGDEARYPLEIHMTTGHKPHEFGFSIYRLDLVESVAIIASRSKGEYDQAYDDITESLMVTKGALYRIVFENSYSGIHGRVVINIGCSDLNSCDSMEYTFDSENAQGYRWWQVKLYADNPSLLIGNNSEVMTLQIEPDRFPEQIEWVLVSSNHNYTLQRPFMIDGEEKREVVAYGPLPESSVSRDTLIIPRPNNKQGHALIIMNNGNDIAWLGEGSLLQLYDSQVYGGSPVYIDRFEEENRAVLFFSLIDSDAKGSPALIHHGWTLSMWTSLILGLMLF